MTKLGIGSSPRRREDLRLVTGAGTFGDDFTLPGQTFAAIARSPHAHAILQSIETTKAKELPGVLAVLTAADYLADGLNPLVHSPFTVSPPDITLANRDGKPVFVAPHYPLALDRVRFVGEGVVLVVAETLGGGPRGRRTRRGGVQGACGQFRRRRRSRARRSAHLAGYGFERRA